MKATVRVSESLVVNDVEAEDYVKYHITAYDCPHIPL